MSSHEERRGRRIAMVVGTALRAGPIRLAFEHAGLQVRETVSTDQAEACIEIHGIEACLLALDARDLDEREGSATWGTFLELYPDLPAVIVASGGTPPRVRRVARGPRRLLVEEPFDAAAVVGAAAHAAAHSGGRPSRSMRRASSG